MFSQFTPENTIRQFPREPFTLSQRTALLQDDKEGMESGAEFPVPEQIMHCTGPPLGMCPVLSFLNKRDGNIPNGKILMRRLCYPLGQDPTGFMLNLCLLLGWSPASDAM